MHLDLLAFFKYVVDNSKTALLDVLNIIQWAKALGKNPQNLLENSRGVFVINRILLVEAKV